MQEIEKFWRNYYYLGNYSFVNFTFTLRFFIFQTICYHTC